MRILILPMAIALALSACSLTPKLDKPQAPVPAAFPDLSPESGETPVAHAPETGWRDMFGDPRLQALISLALDNNRDLRLAVLNVDAVQSQFRVQRAARLPSGEIDVSASRERSPAGVGDSPESASVQKQTSLSLGVSAFEVDLFGRVRALTDAAFANYLASQHAFRAAQITLVGAVAEAYFAERLAQEQYQLAERTLIDWDQSLELARLLRKADQNSALEVAQAEGQVSTAQADLEARRRAWSRARNALAVLIGTDIPSDLPPPLPLEDQPLLTILPAGLPSEVLSQRPDILQAEQALVAANADIGAARAAFFPRLSLTASVGVASQSLSGLFDSDQRTWRFTPQITQPIFQHGRLKAELRLAEVRKSAAIVEYERAIQNAFREVADGLAGNATLGRQLDAQQRTVASAERRAELSNLRYRAGLEGRLELLDAQRQLYAARQSLLDLRQEEINNAVALYKALGGGLRERSRPAGQSSQSSGG